MLQLYLLISKHEAQIFDLIWAHHGCDSWEDMFRDYDTHWLKEKEEGVKVALHTMNELDGYVSNESSDSD